MTRLSNLGAAVAAAERAEGARDDAQDAAQTALAANRTIFRATKAELLAAMEGPPAQDDETPGIVTNDPSHTDENPVNGNYVWRGGELVRSDVQQLNAAYVHEAIAPVDAKATQTEEKVAQLSSVFIPGVGFYVRGADGGAGFIVRLDGLTEAIKFGAREILVNSVPQVPQVRLDVPGKALVYFGQNGAVPFAVDEPSGIVRVAHAAVDKLTVAGREVNFDATVNPADVYMRDGELLKVNADLTRMSGWGSSTMERIGPYMSSMAAEFGVSYYNGGDGGAKAPDIAARFGSVPALVNVVGGEIPATGGVTVTSTNMPPNNSMMNFACTLMGVPGVLSSTSTSITFTRDQDGDPVVVPDGTPVIPTIGPQYRDSIVHINMGKNDLTGAGGMVERVNTLTDATFNWLSPFVKRALVWGHFCDTNTPASSAERNQIYAVNAHLADRYGSAGLFLDLHEFLTGAEVWTLTGITPTQTDLDQQALGNKPTSLSTDNGHMNAAAYQAWVTYRVKPRIIELGWMTFVS